MYSEKAKERKRKKEKKKNVEVEYACTYMHTLAKHIGQQRPTYGRNACIPRTSSCQKMVIVIVIG